MRDIIDIAWLAGFLEGEASFGDGKGTPCIQLSSTDQDVLLRAAALMGVRQQGNSYRPKGKASYKPVFACRVYGSRAISWMMTLYLLMGERRQEKIRGILERWKASKRVPRAPKGQRFMALCHPDRVRCADLLCGQCWRRTYMVKYRAAKKAAALNVGATTFTIA